MAQRRASGQRLLLGEDAQRTSGRDARTMNITAARAVANAVRTTLGPKGMDKMLVGSSGSVVVTNDGVTILSEMDIEHPAANMIVEVAETQEEEVGDGTTSAVVLAGELLKRAEELVDQDIHPTTVANGYRRATIEAADVLEDRAIEVDPNDVDTLEQVAMTVMTGKSAEDARDYLAELVVAAIRSAADGNDVDIDSVEVRTAVGRPAAESELIEGVLIEEEPVHDNMPSQVTDASIGLLNTGIEIEEPEIDAEIAVDDPQALREFQDAERDSLRERVDHLVDAGVDVVFATDDIEDAAAEHLSQSGVLAVEDIDEEELTRIARATGAQIATTVNEVTSDYLGHAEDVYLDEIEGEDAVFVSGGDAAEFVTIILRGGTEGAVDEIERAVDDSIHAVRVALESGLVLPGGSAPEVELALAIRDYAESVGGREQLAVEAFADALEVVPRTLAENAGLDPIDALVELRSRHDDGDDGAGLDVVTGEIIDMYDEGVVEPLPVKRQAIESATEAAVMILRIDDVISAS